MAKNILTLLLPLILLCACNSKPEAEHEFPKTAYELSEGVETATYEEAIDYYLELAKTFPEINVHTMGQTDSGLPLHLVTYNPDGDFNFTTIRENKSVILINNGIHPGEPDGIDATMMLYRDLATGKLEAPENTVLTTIPVYNIGGSLNRNSTSRANQNGPESYGFRGNARNYDLNRDFIKSDTKNAKAFAEIFHLVQPDLFMDNHVSNGADYQYTLTHLFTQHNKLGGSLGSYLYEGMMPQLIDLLGEAGWDICPYVNVFNAVPEKGFSQFMDSPRYSSGYTTLWNVPGLVVETHMLKPYKNRVEGTYAIMEQMLAFSEENHQTIKTKRKENFDHFAQKEYYPTRWAIDTTQYTTLQFKGYEATTDSSKVTGLTRLQYHRDRPFTKPVKYQDQFKATDSVKVPKAYIIKKSWGDVLALLDINQIAHQKLVRDTVIQVESYKIANYKTRAAPYEGHYLHYNTQVKVSQKEVTFKAGDVYVPTDQAGIRYLLETLEPEATDSFFNWNFFDPILQRKEGFSPYVFEDIAWEMLQRDDALRLAFEDKKSSDPDFAGNWYMQLNWLYERSPHYEAAYLQYPVYRLMGS